MFNLSNDQNYVFPDISEGLKRNLHTSMANSLHPEIFPIHQTPQEWLTLHRPFVELSSFTILPKMIECVIFFFVLFLKKKKPSKKNNRKELDSEHCLYIPPNFEELSAATDRVILLEYLEQYPLIMQSAGMTSKMITFYRQTYEEHANEDYEVDIDCKDGAVKVLAPNEPCPLYGAPRRSEAVTALENNLSIAPVALHPVDQNLFLVVRTSAHGFVIRELDAQKKSFYPNSPDLKKYVNNRLKVHIYRTLAGKEKGGGGGGGKKKCLDALENNGTYTMNLYIVNLQTEKHVILEDLKEAFPFLPDHTLQTTLKSVATKQDPALHEFNNSLPRNFGQVWVPKNNWTPPTDYELTQVVSADEEVLRQMISHTAVRLTNKGIHQMLVLGSFKKLAGQLCLRKEFVQSIQDMYKELENKLKSNDPNEKHAATMKLEALQLIEEELSCVSWFLCEQFLQCKRGFGEMELRGPGNPFRNNEGMNYLREKNTRYSY
ncbi:transcription initiation factor TFIID subunit 1-like protein, partial [Reticulomyxa filosa]